MGAKQSVSRETIISQTTQSEPNNYTPSQYTTIFTTQTTISNQTTSTLTENEDKDIIPNYEALKTNLKLYLLYDNYNNKNSVIIKDLNKKLKNQTNELKLKHEDYDKIQFDLEIIKEKNNKINEVKKQLTITIFVFLILIVINILLIINFQYHVQ